MSTAEQMTPDPKSTPKLAEALAKAQGAFQTASKDKTNPHFGSKYADLASIMEACRGPLSENGLSFVQVLNNDDKGVLVVTRLMHVSGEFIESPCWLPVAQKTPQGYGSAITYARRYGFATLIGIASEVDDDGNAANGSGKPPAPNGTSALKSRVVNPDTGEVKRDHADMVMGNFGRAAGKRLSELSDEDVIFYRSAAKKTLADPAREKFHENEKKRLAIFDAELRFRELPIEDASQPEAPKPTPPKDEKPKTTEKARPVDPVEEQRMGLLGAIVEPEKLPHQVADEKKAAEAAQGPLMVFGPFKSKPISSLGGPELLEQIAFGESKISTLSPDKQVKVRACIEAIKAEQGKREAALKAAVELPEPGASDDEIL